MGDLVGAESAFREALGIWHKSLGDRHLYTRRATSSLAAVLSDEGKYVEADSLLRSVLSLYRADGDSSVEVAVPLRNYGLLLRRTHRLGEAEAALRQALGIYRRELPNDHPRLAEALTALGQVLTDRGRASEAEPLLREAVTIRTQKLGGRDLRTAESGAALGVALAAVGRRPAAESLLVASCGVMAADRWGARQARACNADLERVRNQRERAR
jgi:tetratricopeptide (TPR) repeat protein